MPRSRTGPFKFIAIRVPEDLFAEFMLFAPELEERVGQGYGARNALFLRLIREEVERRKRAIMERADFEPTRMISSIILRLEVTNEAGNKIVIAQQIDNTEMKDFPTAKVEHALQALTSALFQRALMELDN